VRVFNKIRAFWHLLSENEIYGFLSPYVSLDRNDLDLIEGLIVTPDEHFCNLFEDNISNYLAVPNGHILSFGSGRMAFFSLMKAIGIGEGDEVCLTGFTCAVMANAVMRIGATPIYVDIDKETLGMSPTDLRRKITSHTKLIVAQHSFGIPCKIDEILEISHSVNVKVVEDCAISLGSTYKGQKIGTWGDAAIFSLDHTKPLNTLVGGYLYAKSNELAEKVRVIQGSSDHFSSTHVRDIIKRYEEESMMESKSHKRFVYETAFLNPVLHKLGIGNKRNPFLVCDDSSVVRGETAMYPYPAKLHPALAYIGIKSLQKYIESVPYRGKWLNSVLSSLSNRYEVPAAYNDDKCKIVPLRIAFYKNKNSEDFCFVDDWVWFKQPIVATSEPLENFYYVYGTCPNAESIGKRIMNYPVILDPHKQKKFLNIIKHN
jgi:dTDP-4-amino-4,6-dideoxygalactose transaminase